jgi:hypothetical protein
MVRSCCSWCFAGKCANACAASRRFGGLAVLGQLQMIVHSSSRVVAYQGPCNFAGASSCTQPFELGSLQCYLGV